MSWLSEQAMVGTSVVVIKDIRSNNVVVGNPTYNILCRLKEGDDYT